MNLKIERLNNTMMREISMILQTEIKDSDIRFVTVTAVKTTSDIRKILAERIEVRHIPKLEFVFDESIEYGNKIEAKIKEIHEEKDN